MKAAAVISLSSLLLVTLVAFSPSLSSAASPPAKPLDISGQTLLTGTGYYILPVVRGRGGGVTLGQPRNGTCPLGVVQDQFEVSNGLPVTFSPASGKKGVIPLSTDLNIKFSAASICVQSTVWKLGPHDDKTGQWFVTTGGAEGNPGRETISNWFKIAELGKDYKLVFCPTVCNYCKVVCRDVGIYVDGATRRLALSDVPFRVMFKKA
ncbi:kunitz trypsin inhibitor 5-like [Punica granatum]|uniref:Uncharacterized protein n=2 Tax=Punica granatum TaxID=22663 RepID=A0A218XEQ6_PUNGR|nr:kunitz trypsin inhibitor 5-like [Punica granatum]OWM82961.1 hypothetical protein CDL15_Pgr005361 [Punica granatum]PKI75555.1 hypothetical protein CRG98_004091 [Punica granatum]